MATDIRAFLRDRKSKTFNSYYNGVMSYALHGKEWETYVAETFPDLAGSDTSENIFKAVIDLYAENLVPVPDQLRGFSNSLVPLLSRGECPVVVDAAGNAHFPEHYEMISDGRYTVAAIFTRSLERMKDYVTYIWSDGKGELWAKDIPDDFSEPDPQVKYEWVEDTTNNILFRFALDDKGFGGSLAALQDRINHSIIDQTVIAEMYARPFWYLMNVEKAPENPYLPKAAQGSGDSMTEAKTDGAAGRIFTTSSEGPFGQLTPPTIQDMIAYHDSILDKVSQSTGIPQHYFKPGTGTPPTGVALKVLSKRFNTKVARMRDDIAEQLEELAKLLGVEAEAKVQGEEPSIQLWPESDDLLQDALDAHGLSLVAMGYPLKYIAEVVTPGVDLDDYMDDSLGEPTPDAQGDPAAAEQQAASAGQGQVQAGPEQVRAYAENPGAKARG